MKRKNIHIESGQKPNFHPDDPKIVLLASGNQVRAKFLQDVMLGGRNNQPINFLMAPGGEEVILNETRIIAWEKVRFALNEYRKNQNKIPPLQAAIAQDTQNESLPRPDNLDTVRNTFHNIYQRYLKTGTCFYTSETATAIVSSSGQKVIEEKHIYQLNPKLVKDLLINDHLLDTYNIITQVLTNIQPVNIAGGLCFEALLAMKVITHIDGQQLNGLTLNQLSSLIYNTMYHLLCGFPQAVLNEVNPEATNDLEKSATLEKIWLGAKSVRQESGVSLRTFYPSTR